MAEVYTNPTDENDTNEANLARVQADSALEGSIRDTLTRWIRENPTLPLAVIQMDMDKSVEIRRCGIAYKLKVLEEVSALLKTYETEHCLIIPHGTRDDVTILRVMTGGVEQETAFVSDLLKTIETTPFGADLDRGPFHITYSAGLACYPFHGRTAAQLLELADGAVRWAKDHGRNTFSMAQTGYHYIQQGVIDARRWNKLLQLSARTGLTAEELIREGYEALFQKHAAFYRFCNQE